MAQRKSGPPAWKLLRRAAAAGGYTCQQEPLEQEAAVSSSCAQLTLGHREHGENTNATPTAVPKLHLLQHCYESDKGIQLAAAAHLSPPESSPASKVRPPADGDRGRKGSAEYTAVLGYVSLGSVQSNRISVGHYKIRFQRQTRTCSPEAHPAWAGVQQDTQGKPHTTLAANEETGRSLMQASCPFISDFLTIIYVSTFYILHTDWLNLKRKKH